MFTGSILAFIVVVFLLVLLTVALIGERITFAERQQHIVYSLALGIHCTTWAMFAPLNPQGCWNWWGYTDRYYATQEGQQIKAIHTMINTFTQKFPKK